MAINFSISQQVQTDGNLFTLNTTNPTFSSEPKLTNVAINTLFKSQMTLGDKSTEILGFKQNDSNDFHINVRVNGEARSVNQDETVYKYYLTRVNDNNILCNLITDNATIPTGSYLLGRSNVLINKNVVKSSTIWFEDPSANQKSPYDMINFIPLFGVFRYFNRTDEDYTVYGFGVDTQGTFQFGSILQGGYTNQRFNPNNSSVFSDISARFMAQIINTTDASEELATLTDRVNKIDLDIIEINKKLASLPQDIAGYVAAAASEVSKLYVAR